MKVLPVEALRKFGQNIDTTFGAENIYDRGYAGLFIRKTAIASKKAGFMNPSLFL